MTPRLFNRIVSFPVSESNILSDHCAIEFSMSYKNQCDATSIEDDYFCARVRKKYPWNEDLHGQYLNSLKAKEKSFQELYLH